MSKLVLVEKLSQYRIRYVVEVDDNDPNSDAVDHALNIFTQDDYSYIDIGEFSQLHLGEIDISSREISKDEYLRLFEEDNAYLETWTETQKLGFINKKGR